MARDTYYAQVKKFADDLHAAVDPETIHEQFVESYGDEVKKQVIKAANAGQGPEGPYPRYSAEYQKLKERKGGGVPGNWLRGITRKAGVAMLDEANFSWVPDGDDLFLLWLAPNTQIGTYAEVHNYGILKMGKGRPKKREFMQFATPSTNAAVMQAYRQALDIIAATFSAGHTP